MRCPKVAVPLSTKHRLSHLHPSSIDRSLVMSSEHPLLHLPARHRYPAHEIVPPHSAFVNGEQQDWVNGHGHSGYKTRLDPPGEAKSSVAGRLHSSFQYPSIPVMRFVFLCSLWYFSSAMSSNTGKVIMNQFRYPITLTFVQFAFVASYCLLCTTGPVGISRFRRPTRAILRNTFPMALFQVGGHIFSSMAISRIPVSTVHTIKVCLPFCSIFLQLTIIQALSPLFTVATYAILFGVSYSSKTYLSLLPLTIGVMLATTFDISGANIMGLLCAFGSAIVFVSSNIFFKKIMPSHTSPSRETSTQKLDKINLLLYSSGMAFLLMIPLWIFYDLPSIMYGPPPPMKAGIKPHNIPLYFFMNGTVHFGQNILAFSILQNTSPVTYSIASLIKRVAVIIIAIIWFSQPVHPVQAMGICLTFVGLWMYNSAKESVERGEIKMQRVEASRNLMLPTSQEESTFMSPATFTVPSVATVDKHLLKPLQVPGPITRGSSVYPSPPHSPPLSHPPLSATAPSFHPTAIQQRRTTVSKPFVGGSEPMAKPISVL
jgi:solute carrier family 35 protein E1